MRPRFHPRLINPPFADPGLFIPFSYEKRAILFDLGDLQGLTARDLLKVTHVFVTHTHMDHFVGFDQLLRVLLGREKELCLYGPPEFFHRVEGKLAGYTWNLVEEYQYQLSLSVTELHPNKKLTKRYTCQDRFVPDKEVKESPFTDVLLGEPSFFVKAGFLDHRTTCLGFSLVESFSININKERLNEEGLPVGPWLNRLKKALYAKEDPHTPFIVTWPERGEVKGERAFALGDLASKIATISPGQKIAYITDIIGSDENLEKAVILAQDADHLFIEAGFMERDKETAQRKYHLTARQAGLIAKRAGVKQMTIFHFSPRYSGHEEEIWKEAMEAFRCSCPDS
jgi:ribonuclease Z